MDITAYILAGLAIGFLGSFHCLGMCGPLALALPVRSADGKISLVNIIVYNLGRAVTYSLLGLVFGFMGSRLHLWGLQRYLSVGGGVLIFSFLLLRFSPGPSIPAIRKFNAFISGWLGRLLRGNGSLLSFTGIGLLNGLLPCGLVYVAMASALVTGSTGYGALLMFSFGLGTLPMMAGVMLFGHRISWTARQKLNRAVPFFVGLVALLLILRGLNLGIPYVSPAMASESTEAPMCHPSGR